MKFYLIADNIDTRVGMRLAGIDGVVTHSPEETKQALDEAMKMQDVGIVLMTEKTVSQIQDTVYDYKLSRKTPLIVEIPDRHSKSKISDTISRYLSDAVGIKL